MKRWWVIFGCATYILLPPLLTGQSDQETLGCPKEPDTQLAAISVRALTPKLMAVDDLHASNFDLLQNRTLQKVCGFVHVRQPTSIGILLDTSGSMTGGGCAMSQTLLPRPAHWSKPLTIARAAIEELLSTSGPQDEYFLGLASEQPTIQRGFTHDSDQIRAGLPVAFKGKTALVDSIYLALSEMSKARWSNRALVVISDGCDNLSKGNLRELSHVISTLAVALFFLTPGNPRDVLRISAFPTGVDKGYEAAVRDDLFQLAERSGGYVFRVPNVRQIGPVGTQLSSVIRTPYLLYFNEPVAHFAKQDGVHLKVNGVQPPPILLYGGAVRYPLNVIRYR